MSDTPTRTWALLLEVEEKRLGQSNVAGLTCLLPGLPFPGNDHLPARIARRSFSEQVSAFFQARNLKRSGLLVWLEGSGVAMATASSAFVFWRPHGEKPQQIGFVNFFLAKMCPRSIRCGRGVVFPSVSRKVTTKKKTQGLRIASWNTIKAFRIHFYTAAWLCVFIEISDRRFTWQQTLFGKKKKKVEQVKYDTV